MAELPPGALPSQIIADRLGAQPPPGDDLAFQPPQDPLSGDRLKLRAGVVYRDIPIVTIATFWTPPLIRQALADLVMGIFDAPSQLIDSMTGDSRVQSSLSSRVGGLLGRDVDFLLPKKYRDSSAAKECRDAFIEAWPTMAAESFCGELQRWAIMLGHGHGTIAWDTSGEYAIPHPRIWHPRYTYYDWTYRKIIALTQDGQVPIEGGDGHWILHAPSGTYRGWMRGSVRACAPWWLSRNYALRDASRWSEVHGLPLKKLKHPASADRLMVDQFRNSMANLGGETCVDLPQNIPEGQGQNGSFDVEYLEAEANTFEGFFKLIAACDQEITLTLQAQTLTSSMPEGGASYAAARVHADVKQALLEADARAFERMVYMNLARPFAAMNFGLADLAPLASWDITPYEDFATKARTALEVSQVAVNLANSGHEIEDLEGFGKQFGVRFGKLIKVAPRIGDRSGDTRAPGEERGGGRRRRDGDGDGVIGGSASDHARIASLVEENRRLRIAAGLPPELDDESERDLAAAFEAGAARRARRLASR